MTRKHLGLLSVGRLPILVLLLVFMTTAPAKAQVFREWNDPTGGNYDDTSNWLTGDVADTTNEYALFNIAGTYDVTLTSGVTTLVGKLFVFDGDVTFNASGSTSAIFEMDIDASFIQNVTLTQGPSMGDVTLNVGDQLGISNGSTFNVLQGSDVTANGIDVSSGGSSGTMIVDGTGSTLAVSSLARIGTAGQTGTLTFQNDSTGNSLSGSVELMSNSTQAGTIGRLNVLSGSTLQTDNISVGLSPSADAVQEGTLTVDGTDSTLTMTGASTLTIGDDINPNIVSDVIVSNSGVMSTGTGAILIQNSGHLNIQAGTFNANGNVTVDSGTITRGSGSGGFNLGSGLTLTAKNAAQINFGGAYTLDQGATFDIQSNADFTTTGSLNIDDGTINVSDGTFNANSNVNINGGTITRDSSGIFALASGLTLTATNNAQINFSGAYSIDQGTTFSIQSGADFSTTDSLSIDSNGDGTLVVDGPGSSVTTGAGTFTWGLSSNTADVTFRNGAMGDLGGLNLSSSTLDGTTSIFRIESGASVTTNSLRVVASGVQSSSETVIGTVTVDGVGSSLTQNGASVLIVGNTYSGTATLNVQNGGTFTTGTGLASIRTTGTVNLNTAGTFNLLGNLDLPGVFNLVGGTLSAVDPVITNGELNFVFGTLELGSDQALDSQRIAELDIGLLDFGKTFRVNGVSTLLVPLTLAGGTFTTESLVNPLLLDFQSGTFELTSDDLVVGPTGLFGSPLTVASEQAIKVTNTTTVESGATLAIESDGTFMAGTLVNGGSVVLDGPAAVLSGTTISNNSGGIVGGEGTISAAFTNNADGELQGLAGKNIVLAGSGNTNSGQITLSGGQVHFTQDFTNSATGLVIGSGTLRADGSITNDGDMAFSATANIIGDVTNNVGGTIISAGGTTTFFDDVVNNGEIRTNQNSFTVYFGSYSGNGDTGIGGTVIMEGDLKPGSSPGTMAFGGDLSFGPQASLEIEIGGLIAGSEYDQVTVADDISLGGMLDVSLINPFSLSPGQSFEIIDVSGVLSDTFLGLAEGGLVGNFGGTNLLITYAGGDGNDVTLLAALPGDFDIDGDVDGFDFLGWQRGESPNPLSQSDLADWEANYGTVAPLAAVSTQVPEPCTTVLFLMLSGTLLMGRQSIAR
jgi:T5SS/PEP-CTERM-associated repeat protein